MPTLSFVDGMRDASGTWTAVHEIVDHQVSDRDAAFRVLKSDLQQTADRDWAAPILEKFQSGENLIVAANGPSGDFFAVKYQA